MNRTYFLQNFSPTSALVFKTENSKTALGWVRQSDGAYEVGKGQDLHGSFPTMAEALAHLGGAK